MTTGMWGIRFCRVVTVVGFPFFLGACGLNQKELDLTWRNAMVSVPGKYLSGLNFITGKLSDSRNSEELSRRTTKKIPTVLFIHGCSWMAGWLAYSELFEEAGYAVIGPDSFAREYRPKTCSGREPIRGAPIEEVLMMRQEEIQDASRRIRKLPWVDKKNIFLVGHSQGGEAVALYSEGGFKGRIILGTGCQRGFFVPSSEPVLIVTSKGDLVLHQQRSDCETEAGARSGLKVVWLPGSAHFLASIPEAKIAILDFLRKHTDHPAFKK